MGARANSGTGPSPRPGRRYCATSGGERRAGRLQAGRDLSDTDLTTEGLVVDTLLSDEANKAN